MAYKVILTVLVLLIAAVAASAYVKAKQNDNEPEPQNLGTMERFALTAGTTHFKMSEFNSKDGVVVPEKYRGNLQILMNQLEVIRAYFGGAAITINSGYRSPAHNASIGGAKGSMHLFAMAADIRVKDKTPAQVRAGIEELIKARRIINGGVGAYPTFTHYDIGTSRRWKV